MKKFNQENLAEHIEKILRDNFDSFFHQVYFYIKIQDWYDEGIKKTANAIAEWLVSHVKVDEDKVKNELVNIDYELCNRDKSGYAMESVKIRAKALSTHSVLTIKE